MLCLHCIYFHSVQLYFHLQYLHSLSQNPHQLREARNGYSHKSFVLVTSKRQVLCSNFMCLDPLMTFQLFQKLKKTQKGLINQLIMHQQNPKMLQLQQARSFQQTTIVRKEHLALIVNQFLHFA